MGTTYVVRAGDCMSSIAHDYGLLWDKLWNHPDNKDLKSKRKDPDVLLEGDLVIIPDIVPRKVSLPTDARHRFVLRSAPTMLRLRITEMKPEPAKSAVAGPSAPRDPAKDESSEDPPYEPVRMTPAARANVPYGLVIDGKTITGSTDGDGKIEQPIEPNAQRATLTLEPGQPTERTIEVKLGYLDPVDTIAGAKQRLGNLGYDCGDRTAEETPDYSRTLKAFQAHAGLTESGELDDATKGKLEGLHPT
jgi:hypothetical protein